MNALLPGQPHNQGAWVENQGVNTGAMCAKTAAEQGARLSDNRPNGGIITKKGDKDVAGCGQRESRNHKR